jgi:hypothetical protein
MPVELVLLSDVPPTATSVVAAAADAHPNGSYLDYHDGLVRQLVDGSGNALLQVYPSHAVEDPTNAAVALVDPPATFGLWTDLTVPFDNQAAGRAVADNLAALVGGVIKERA